MRTAEPVSTTASAEPRVGDVRVALRRSSAALAATTDAPRLEAELLLAHVLRAPRTALLAYPERTLAPDDLADYDKLVEWRAAGQPLPYLVGHIEFYGLRIEVTPEVLIPRPETEVLVDLAIERRPGTVVDVGTGSGCISVALAVNLPMVEVTAVDISSAALAVARRNLERHGVGERVRLVTGDVLSPRPGPVDLIVSNPPYVAAGERSSLPLSVREYEPWLALDGGAGGLDVLRRLLAQAAAVLKLGGALLVEIGSEQGEAARALAGISFPEAVVRTHPDLAGRDRVLEVQT
ncbi:MAG: peptide chain release factor N(5)-glutamine methyltransferase [Anaerolineales bacterium]|nr:MAG: peptide chain release factor N(5)-glutamine methyltransferase [Anaerolineales bacterium]